MPILLTISKLMPWLIAESKIKAKMKTQAIFKDYFRVKITSLIMFNLQLGQEKLDMIEVST